MAQTELIPNDHDQDAELIDQAGAEHLPAGKWPQMLADFLDVLRHAYARAGIAEAEADRLAHAGVLAMSEYLGGRYFYLAKGDSLRQALRDDQVWREFDGRNIPALAQKYDMTERHVYRVLAEQRAMRKNSRQRQLFPDG